MDENLELVYGPSKKNPLYESLYDLVDEWDDELQSPAVRVSAAVDQAILAHARVLLAMPDATFKEIWTWLNNYMTE